MCTASALLLKSLICLIAFSLPFCLLYILASSSSVLFAFIRIYVNSLSVVEAITLKATTPLFTDVGRMSVELEESRRSQ